MTRLVLFELFVTNLLCLSTNKNLLVSWQFSGPCGVTKYGSGWRKDVVNQCLEFDTLTHSAHWHKETELKHENFILQLPYNDCSLASVKT